MTDCPRCKGTGYVNGNDSFGTDCSECEGTGEMMSVPVIKHELKSWVGLFEPLLRGEKTHDLRVMDRDFQIGDLCWVREWNPVRREYTGRDLKYEITYITSAQHAHCAFSPNALHPAMAVLSVKVHKNLIARNPFKETP